MDTPSPTRHPVGVCRSTEVRRSRCDWSSGGGEPRQLFETHGRAWREVGGRLARQLSRRAVKRARIQAAGLVPLLAAILVVYAYRDDLFGSEYDERCGSSPPSRSASLGWQVAADVGRALGPTLFRRLDPGTAGTVGFLIRLGRSSSRSSSRCGSPASKPRTLAVGGAFTAVVLGLAAQQTLGNLFAGMVLLSARPFRVGERVRLQGGGAGRQGRGRRQLARPALHDASRSGEDQIMVPNNVVLQRRRSSRCASPTASTCARGCAPA